jgi:hypothetical protein
MLKPPKLDYINIPIQNLTSTFDLLFIDQCAYHGFEICQGKTGSGSQIALIYV